MQQGDSVILNFDFEDIEAGTLGVVTLVGSGLIEVAFETGQTVTFDEHMIANEWIEIQ